MSTSNKTTVSKRLLASMMEKTSRAGNSSWMQSPPIRRRASRISKTRDRSSKSRLKMRAWMKRKVRTMMMRFQTTDNQNSFVVDLSRLIYRFICY
jgi:hypothetical protein